jgi:hypothetical protein
VTTIDEIIQREVNPFDPVTFKTGNFWQEEDRDSTLIVRSIHQEAIDRIKETLALVQQDNRTRSIMLAGDAGSGKSYLLSRLKQTFNSSAFFAYIGPWADREYIWRHTLRYTVDSLMHVPQGQQESQLILWLKSLAAFADKSLLKNLLGEKGLFVLNFTSTYPSGIYQAREFFGVLYSLTKPELYSIACDWLRGENLDDDTLKALGVRNSIDSEEAARGILGNFGRISAATMPIVLCFDNIDASPRLSDGSCDLQPVFRVNTIVHNENLKNFLVIISLVTNNWRENQHRIEQADKDRIEQYILLKSIDLEQGEALWEMRLHSLHSQANPKPESTIFPFDREKLAEKFPGGKTTPRNVLKLGQQLFIEYKLGKQSPKVRQDKQDKLESQIPKEDPIAAFKLLWQQEFKKTQTKTTRIRQFSSPELIQMLQQAMKVLGVKIIKHRMLPSKTYSSYSFNCQLPGKSEAIGIVWNEDPSLTSFFHVMQACEKALKQKLIDRLILLRAESLGTFSNRGYKVYRQIFADSSHRHLIANLDSIYYLKTYQNLVNAAAVGDLVVAFYNPNVEELETLMSESKLLAACSLLQDLGLSAVKNIPNNADNNNGKDKNLQEAKEFILSIVKTQHFLGKKALIEQTIANISPLENTQVDRAIEELAEENQIDILGSPKHPEEQLICLMVQ